MPLVVNLVRTVSSAKFICCCWRSPWCDCHVKHTRTESAKIGQVINCGLTDLIVSVFPVLLTNFDTAHIWRCWQNGRYFYKMHWQSCICRPNELKREVKKKLGEPSKNLRGPWCYRQVLPVTSIAVQKPNLEIRPHLESSQTRFKTILTPIRTPHAINGSWSQSRKSWRKDVISLDKTVNDARQPKAV